MSIFRGASLEKSAVWFGRLDGIAVAGILSVAWLSEVCVKRFTLKKVQREIPLTAYWITAFKKKINAFSRFAGHTWPKSQGLIKGTECWAILYLCARISMVEVIKCSGKMKKSGVYDACTECQFRDQCPVPGKLPASRVAGDRVCRAQQCRQEQSYQLPGQPQRAGAHIVYPRTDTIAEFFRCQ